MPVRNGGTTLRVAVRSTLRALPRDAELVIYDDCSDDSAINDLPSDNHLRVVRGGKPAGVARGLNTLLSSIDSPLVARMDADDLSLPWRFNHELRALDNADVVFTTVVHFGSRLSQTRPTPPVQIAPGVFPLRLLVANPVAHSTMLGRTDHIRRVGGYRSVPSEDYDLWLRLAAMGTRLMRLALPSLMYRIHPGQVTATGDWLTKAAADEHIVGSYTALARKHLGVDPDWYPALRAARRGRHLSDADSKPLMRFQEAIEASSRHLSRADARALNAKCRAIVGRALHR